MVSHHAVVTAITDILKEQGVWFELFEHEPVHTSEEAARARPEYSLHQGAKAMIIRVKRPVTGNEFMMLVLPADLKFDFNKTKTLLGAKDIRFATEPEVFELTKGVQPGGVPPFGNLFGLAVIADPSLFENEKIIFNAGDRCVSVAMKSTDYKILASPRIESIT